MQKIVSAIQVFGIIAMFPIVVVPGMNHGAGTSKSHPPSGVIQKTERTNCCLSEMVKDKKVIDAFPPTLDMFLLDKAY